MFASCKRCEKDDEVSEAMVGIGKERTQICTGYGQDREHIAVIWLFGF